jgi:hypothetical protein
MAYVSFSLNRALYEEEANQIVVGTDDGGGTYDVTLSMNLAVGLNRLDVIKVLKAFTQRLENGAFNDLVNI